MPRAVRLELATYADVVARAGVVARWVDHLMTEVVRQLLPAGGGDPIVAVAPPGSTAASVKPLTAERLGHVLDRFGAGEVGFLRLAWGMTAVDVSVLRTPPWQPSAPNRLSLVAQSRWWPAEGAAALQDGLTAAAVDFAADLGLAAALLDAEAVGEDDDPLLDVDWRHRLPWCGWGTLLTAGHLDALGGRDQVQRSAPVASTVDVPGARLWLQLSDRLGDASEKQRAALEEYLAPLLPARTGRPAAAEPVEDLVVERGDEAWDSLVFAVVLRAPAATAAVEALGGLLANWQRAAERGAWVGPIHRVDPPAPVTAEGGEPLVVWAADMGSATSQAVDVLVATVEGWRRQQGVAVDRLVIGRSRYW